MISCRFNRRQIGNSLVVGAYLVGAAMLPAAKADTVAETVLASFGSATATGDFPAAGLAQGNDGSYYGTTLGGGNGFGALFKITPVGLLTTLYTLNNSSGTYPHAGLTQGTDGNFYGTAQDGERPNGLLSDGKGNFYGTAFNGGSYNAGTAFKLTLSGALTTLYTFGAYPGDSAAPVGGFVQSSDGSLYGVAEEGGTYGCGTVFRLSAP